MSVDDVPTTTENVIDEMALQALLAQKLYCQMKPVIKMIWLRICCHALTSLPTCIGE